MYESSSCTVTTGYISSSGWTLLTLHVGLQFALVFYSVIPGIYSVLWTRSWIPELTCEFLDAQTRAYTRSCILLVICVYLVPFLRYSASNNGVSAIWVIPVSHITSAHRSIYRVGQKTWLFLSADNFAMTNAIEMPVICQKFRILSRITKCLSCLICVYRQSPLPPLTHG